MNFLEEITNELRQEAGVTRRYLEQVDFGDRNFQPHNNSEKLGRLAIHVAEIIAWWKNILEHEELNFLNFEPKPIDSTEELLTFYDHLCGEAMTSLTKASESQLDKNWSMKYGDEILFTLNKREVLRKFCMNHLIHHRAQLGIYLRMLGKSIPATYGPSADDTNVTLIESFNM